MSALSSSSNSSGGSAPSSGGAQRVTYNEALDTLTAMFPALSPDVIKMVLELHVSDTCSFNISRHQTANVQ